MTCVYRVKLLPQLMYNGFAPTRGLYSKYRGFDRDLIAYVQQPINLSFKSINNWLENHKYDARNENNKYLLEVHRYLGPNLAAAHFVVARGGAVKFLGQDVWYEQDKEKKNTLPKTPIKDIFVEAIDASRMELVYCSFDNFVRLPHLQYLCLRGCQYLDDWCLDRFVQFSTHLKHLDLSECPKVTERGLASLHRLKQLRQLDLYSMPAVTNQSLVGLLLEEAMPKCHINGINFNEDIYDGNALSTSPYLSGLLRRHPSH